MKVIDSWAVSKYTLLTFDEPILFSKKIPQGFQKIVIDGVEYTPVIAYDAPKGIGIVGNIDATGKDAQFV